MREIGFTVCEEICGLATKGSTRCIDIIAITNTHAYILCPTIRYETHAKQPHQVDADKRDIYDPNIPYYKEKYCLKEI